MTTINSLLALKQSRSARFWSSIRPYLRSAGNSLPGLLFVGLTGLWLYNRLVDGLPDSFPAVLACTFVLTYGIGSVWIRTFLMPADLIYLLPLESRMSGYFRSCFKTGILLQTVKTALFWSFLWPLYSMSALSEHTSFIGVLAVLVLIKWLGIYFWWKILHIRTNLIRLTYSVIRIMLLFGLVYAVLTLKTALAVLLIGLCSIIFVLMLRIPDTYQVAWERLIELERRRISQWRAALSQFAEMPNEQPDVWNNPLARLARYFPLHKRHAYRYLYFLTWCRSPIFGLTVRLTAVGCLLSIVAESGWLQAALGLLFAFGLRLQLLELVRYHRYGDGAFAFPVPEHVKLASARFIARFIGGVSVILLFTPFMIDRL